MPFTPAHAAAVLPLGRSPLPMSALVAGSLAPDLPMFLPGRAGYELTHSGWGIVTVDVLAALAVVWIWFGLVREPYADVVPWVRHRVAPTASLTRDQLVLAPLAAAVGALTHVVWDAATHPGRWIAVRVEWLQTVHGGLLGVQWAQYVSGVLGIAVVAGYTVWWLGRQPVSRRDPRVRRPLVWCLTAPAVALVAGIGAFATAGSFHGGAVAAAVAGIQSLVLTVIAVSIAWHVRASRAPALAAHTLPGR
ncbi:DUF4184 family protein [Isoptericola sp. S6320L]|uniref:DUF4184 family protein n=1 Tax=Isoptericola sp. S6320L TaxID=2926411 RepID=UPI001FF3E805|nr:DUF4184 family protein [Isoptericola sp. S6320L]MCK0115975.1 DUF4184 family protein [Isoptericola sp. S6320L]